jgi:hypothetical protein
VCLLRHPSRPKLLTPICHCATRATSRHGLPPGSPSAGRPRSAHPKRPFAAAMSKPSAVLAAVAPWASAAPTPTTGIESPVSSRSSVSFLFGFVSRVALEIPGFSPVRIEIRRVTLRLRCAGRPSIAPAGRGWPHAGRMAPRVPTRRYVAGHSVASGDGQVRPAGTGLLARKYSIESPTPLPRSTRPGFTAARSGLV